MAQVSFCGVNKSYGTTVALEHLDLRIEEGEFLSLLGPSGCGKTTTLRLIAGFTTPTGGSILFQGRDVTRLAPNLREIGMVFQDYALFPHMTVAENIGFGLVERKKSKREVDARVSELLDLIRLPEVRDRFPAELSGGQAQRVAVARAVAYTPKVLLMDEPLGALDLKLRESMQLELRRIQQELKITTVYVTHDQTEAMNMSDRIVVMNRGRAEQIGTAREIYDFPRTEFVASFVGQISMFEGELARDGNAGVTVRVGSKTIMVSRCEHASGTSVKVGVRPEYVTMVRSSVEATGENRYEGVVLSKQYLGNVVRYNVAVEDLGELAVELRADLPEFAIGDSALLAWQADKTIVLAA